MSFTAKQRERFEGARDALLSTAAGRESTMYGHLRDLFIEVLGYPAKQVDIDTAGARGRPDLTVFAPGGNNASHIAWIVVEAKDERGAVATTAGRAALFAAKAKYITADTAWLVMVDPEMLVARPAQRGALAITDIEVPFDGLTIEAFAEALAPLHADRAGIPAMLQRFRDGDETIIATDKLTGPSGDPDEELAIAIARNTFFDALAETTQLLQRSVRDALVATRPRRAEIEKRISAFRTEFHDAKFTPYPISVQGKPASREEAIAHRSAAQRLTRFLAAEPALARLTLDGLPRFAERTGIDPEKEQEKLETFFANETANLILARILLIRFLEDHGFFDQETPDGTVRRRYLCNGGVQAFQGMRAYFGQGYTRLLEDAYRSGAHVYAAAFDETELDWVLALADTQLSDTVEWSMFRFARYDFTTVRGDILTGIYDRFLDKHQRKQQGEYYTPPSIARYILDRLDLQPDDEILDPACGSGTFLIERYQQAIGEAADMNLATYDEAREVVERLAGNDLNPFSAILTQIQILWHLLSFGPAVRAEGFPDLRIAERANSLVPSSLNDPSQTRFGEIDQSRYAAVVGNPPYVRPERGQDLEESARAYFSEPRARNGISYEGITPDKNIYRLFIYRALDYWCRQAESGAPGKLGFVLPLSFCGAEDAKDLRQLFALGGRWTIREIVDMEVIWREVFDADVLPMIFIAEARPPHADDKVTIRLADERCVIRNENARRPTFDFTKVPEIQVTYPRIFAPDRRLMTRLTPERAEIIEHLRGVGTLSDAAKRYWTRRRRDGQDVSDTPPSGVGEAQWAEQRLIKYGIALRGQLSHSDQGLDLFKGENIRTGSLVGEPVHRRVDVTAASSPSVWAYPQILPPRMFAFPLIEQVPCAAAFDPTQQAMLNTVTVFGPRDDLVDFPFDVLVISRIYSFYYILALRRSFMNKLRSHMYPTAIAELPWSESLPEIAEELRSLGVSFFDACQNRYKQEESLASAVEAVGLEPLRTVYRSHTSEPLIL